MATTPTNLTNSRFPFEAQIAEMPPQHQYVIKNLWNAIADVQGAVPILKSQIEGNKTAIATATNTINTSTASESITQVVSLSPTVGGVNNQIENLTYITTQEDNGDFILFNDASPIAVSLAGAPVITLPWFCVIINYGVGLVTLTPLAGTISYPNNLAAASMGVPQGNAAIIAYDGINYWAVLIPVSSIPPQNTPAVSHEWIDAYNAITGVFSQTQPGFSDLSGTVTPSQLPTPTPTTIGGVESIGPVASEWINEIDTAGVPHLSQPSFADLSGQISPSTQMPASGVAAGSYTDTNLTVNAEGQITAASNGGGGGVSSLNSLTGALSLTSTGATVTITPSGSNVNLEVTGGGSGLPVNNPTFTGTMTGPQYCSNGSAPTAAAGGALPLGAVITVYGTDTSGLITISYGANITAGLYCTVTFATPYPTRAAFVVTSPFNAQFTGAATPPFASPGGFEIYGPAYTYSGGSPFLAIYYITAGE